MYRIIGVIWHKTGSQARVRLKFKLPNGQDQSFEFNHTGNITHGTIISTMVTQFSINPNDIIIPLHIAVQLPIHV